MSSVSHRLEALEAQQEELRGENLALRAAISKAEREQLSGELERRAQGLTAERIIQDAEKTRNWINANTQGPDAEVRKKEEGPFDSMRSVRDLSQEVTTLRNLVAALQEKH